jgi:Trk K+ transport system NAD-binding subunit
MNGAGLFGDGMPVAVCGLGTLGQYCVSYLKEFGVRVAAVERRERADWELAGFPELVDTLVTGDCRDPGVLARLDLVNCRAILILTKDERVNIATAFAARAINPALRILVRSSQENLNDLLGRHLGDFAAIEPTAISADAFALEALGDETLGLFELGGKLIRVGAVEVESGRHIEHRRLGDFESHSARLLAVTREGAARPPGFHDWDPDGTAAAGDVLTFVEIDGSDPNLDSARRGADVSEPAGRRSIAEAWRGFRSVWTGGTPTQRAALLCAIVIPAIFLIGSVLYKEHYKDISWHDALNVSSVLIIGGYDNVFGALKLPFPIPVWLHLFSFAQTVAGTLFVGIVYAFLTERVLSARFQFRRRRPPMPRANHTVLVGMGRVGKAVASRLDGLRRPIAATDRNDLDPAELPDLPFVAGDAAQALERLNIENARCLMALTDDEVANLELALQVRAANPAIDLVIRTDDPYFSKNISELVPRAHALGVNALAGEAFAAAAFGEDILSLFRVNGRTALVTRYTVRAGDQLDGRLISSVTYGYDVVPLLHERPAAAGAGRAAKLFPAGDLRLYPGDRLVVLATIEGLRRTEHASTLDHPWRVRIRAASSDVARFEGAMTIARVSGCEPDVARETLERLPATLDVALHRHQALELVRALAKNLVEAEAVEAAPALRTP